MAEDERFPSFDPRFDHIPKKVSKIKVLNDDRFSVLNTDEDFKIGAKFDARGNRLDAKSDNFLSRLYDLRRDGKVPESSSDEAEVTSFHS